MAYNLKDKLVVAVSSRAFGADIFFDDQDVHLEFSKSVVLSAKVIHKSIEKYNK